MLKILQKYLWSLLLVAGHLGAEITPYFATNTEINFGAVLFVQGNCTMSHVNGAFSNISPAAMCGAGGNGTPGRYVIVANPNQTVSFTMSQRNNQGDGLMFIPEGQLISDTENHAFSAGVAQEINSGVSGVVNIHIGGRLFILTPMSPSSNLGFTFVDGIEWSIVP